MFTPTTRAAQERRQRRVSADDTGSMANSEDMSESSLEKSAFASPKPIVTESPAAVDSNSSTTISADSPKKCYKARKQISRPTPTIVLQMSKENSSTEPTFCVGEDDHVSVFEKLQFNLAVGDDEHETEADESVVNPVNPIFSGSGRDTDLDTAEENSQDALNVSAGDCEIITTECRDRADKPVLIVEPDSIAESTVATSTSLTEPKNDIDDECCRKVSDLLNNPPAPGSARTMGSRGGTGASASSQDPDFSMMNQLLNLGGGGGFSGSGSGGEELMDIQNVLARMDQQQLMQLLIGTSTLFSLQEKLSLRWNSEREYDELINRRFTPNATTTIPLDDTDLVHNDKLRSTHRNLDDLISSGTSALGFCCAFLWVFLVIGKTAAQNVSDEENNPKLFLNKDYVVSSSTQGSYWSVIIGGGVVCFVAFCIGFIICCCCWYFAGSPPSRSEHKIVPNKNAQLGPIPPLLEANVNFNAIDADLNAAAALEHANVAKKGVNNGAKKGVNKGAKKGVNNGAKKGVNKGAKKAAKG